MDDGISNKPKFQLSEFYKKNKKKIISAILVIITSIIILVIIDDYKKKKNIDISKKFNEAKILIEKNSPKEALKMLEIIIFKKNNFYSPSALNLIIDNNLIKDKNKILSYYDQIISNNKLDLEIKNLFILKKIIYLGDDIKENELLNSLKPLIQSDSLWKNTASDYIKKYYISKGEFNKAKEFEFSNTQINE